MVHRLPDNGTIGYSKIVKCYLIDLINHVFLEDTP